LTATTGPALAALSWAALRRSCATCCSATGTTTGTTAVGVATITAIAAPALTLLREATTAGTGVLGGIDRPPAASKRSDDSNSGDNRTGISHESTP